MSPIILQLPGHPGRKKWMFALKNPYLPKVKYTMLALFLGGYLMIPVSLWGQTIVQPKQLDYSSAGILYNKEKSIEFRPHTNGAAVGVHFGKIKTYYKTKYYQFDFGFLRHPKEFRQSITFNTGNPFTRTDRKSVV